MILYARLIIVQDSTYQAEIQGFSGVEVGTGRSHLPDGLFFLASAFGDPVKNPLEVVPLMRELGGTFSPEQFAGG